MTHRPRGAAVIWRRNDRNTLEFLLVRTTTSHRWTFPKGGVEPQDASSAEAARREAQEEAGVDGLPASTPLRVYQHTAINQHGHHLTQPVEAWLIKFTATIGPPEPGRQPAWFHLTDARRALSENQPDPACAIETHQVLDAAMLVLKPTAAPLPALHNNSAKINAV